LFIEFFLFWFFLFCCSELCFSRTNTAYVCALIFSIILFLVIWLFYKEFDLFASVLLAIYSSVFLLLSLFIVYFSRYWGKINNNEIFYSDTYIFDIICLFIIFFVSFDLFYFDGFLFINFNFITNNYNWIFKLVIYDYYNFSTYGGVAIAVLMHIILYKFFVLEIFFFNLYLLFGLVLSVSLLYFFKIWLNPSLISHLSAIMRFNFFFFLLQIFVYF